MRTYIISFFNYFNLIAYFIYENLILLHELLVFQPRHLYLICEMKWEKLRKRDFHTILFKYNLNYIYFKMK